MSTLANISIPVGYDYQEELTITENGAAVDVTGATVTFHLYAPGSSTVAITPAPTMTLVTPASGIVRLVLTDEQTATLTRGMVYTYGVKILDGTGLKTPPVYGLAYAADIPGAT